MKELQEDTSFSQEIDAWVDGGYSYNHPPIHVMQTPLSLQLVGVKPLSVYVDPSKLRKTMLTNHPEITPEILKQLPEALRDPMMIFRSKTQPDRIVVALSLKDSQGVEILVPFALDKPKVWEQANIITAIYGKDDRHGRPRYSWYKDSIKDGFLLYANREKAAQFLLSAGVQFPMEEQTNSFLTYNIKDEKDLVKFKQEKEEEKKMADYNMLSEDAIPNMEAEESLGDNELSASEMEEYHAWLEEEQRNADLYHQEISDSLTVAEESLEDNAAKELRSIADDLHTSMKNVEEAEQNCGADQETWDGYAPRHENIIRTIEQAGDVKSEGKSDEECSRALLDAQESMREGTAYMQERCELILQREKEYQEQIEGLRRRIEELEREREVKVQSPEELARCLAVSTEFLAAIDAMRKEAKSQPRIVASEMFAASRESVKEAYYSVKLAPTKVKSYLKQKVHKAIDGVLHSVAGVFDKGIAALQQRRDEILKKSHEVQSATEFYRDAMKKETEGGKVQGTMEMERRVASLMAKKGFGVYAIEKTLHAESPHRKEMEKGEAKNIAKDSVREREEQREEKSR